MNRSKTLLLALFVLGSLVLPTSAVADSVFRANLMAGVGGPLDEDEAGLSNSSFQLGFSVEPEDQLLVGVRVGQLDLGSALVGNLIDSSIDFATVVGEYRFTESFYESGLYIGLGLYQLDGTLFFGQGFSEEAVGLTLGISGEFLLTESLGFVLEISGHLTNLDTIDTLMMGHAGVSFHF
ncbi:MAG: hypothetical protein ACE5GX_04590 [Thermoanaerobaculia bacterium]